MTEIRRPVPDQRQRQAWLRFFKKLREQEERKAKPPKSERKDQ